MRIVLVSPSLGASDTAGAYLPSRRTKVVNGVDILCLTPCLQSVYVLFHVKRITARSVVTAHTHMMISTSHGPSACSLFDETTDVPTRRDTHNYDHRAFSNAP